MDKSIIVSVCCITYNHEKYVRQCLEGFVMQKTNFPFEVIIHDDASTDNTQTIIKEYVAKYPTIIKPILQTENQYSRGLRRILATHCFPRANGKYIAICESDDYWTDPNKLQKQVDFMELHPDCTMCFHNAVVKNELKKKVVELYKIEDREYLSHELFSNWIVPTASMILRKSLLASPILLNPMILNGDIIYVLLAADKGKVFGLSETMSVYRAHEAGVTWNATMDLDRLKRYPAHYLFIKKTFKKVPRKDINKKIYDDYRKLEQYYKQVEGHIFDIYYVKLKILYYRIISYLTVC